MGLTQQVQKKSNLQKHRSQSSIHLIVESFTYTGSNPGPHYRAEGLRWTPPVYSSGHGSKKYKYMPIHGKHITALNKNPYQLKPNLI